MVMNEAPRSSTAKSCRPPINLYPTPGKLHGSRKRKSSSRHGPHSDSFEHCENGFLDMNDETTEVDSVAKQESLEHRVDHFEPSSSPAPCTPKSTATYDFNSHSKSPAPKTPKSYDLNTPTSMSPLNREMSNFKHLSLRSPKVAKSPGSSFSHYTKSANTATLTLLTTQSSFDSSEMKSIASPNKTSTPKSLKTVPLTVISDTKKVGERRNAIGSSFAQKSPMKSPQLILSPRPLRPSKHLLSPKSSYLPFPEMPQRIFDDFPVVSIEKPSPPSDSKAYKNVHISPMMSLSPRDNNDDFDKHRAQQKSSSTPPPIEYLSVDLNNKSHSGKKKFSIPKRKNVAVSLLRPASDEALNEMLSLNDGDTDGSLSDSDDEGAFFLSDPSCLSLEPKSYEVSGKNDTYHNGSNNISLTAAYSFMKTKKKKRSNTNGTSRQISTSQSVFPKNDTSNSLLSEGNDKSSSTSLFGMNIIHENSISNASLAEMNTSFCRLKNSESCRNLSEDSSKDSSSFLNPSKSNQSINSLGLCIEGTVTENFVTSRDMITPPIISRPLSSPPPLKQTTLTSRQII